MNPISFKSLGSEEIQNQLFIDLTELFNLCYKENLYPLYLSIGNIFLDISCINALISNQSIDNWEEAVSKDYINLTNKFNSLKMSILNYCIENEALINKVIDNTSLLNNLDLFIQNPKNLEVYNPFIGIDIIYDPGERYLSLYTVNLNKKAEEGEQAIDGYPIEVLYYKEGTILVDFDAELIKH